MMNFARGWRWIHRKNIDAYYIVIKTLIAWHALEGNLYVREWLFEGTNIKFGCFDSE